MPARTWVRQLVASALVSAAAAQSLQWTAIPYPAGDAQVTRMNNRTCVSYEVSGTPSLRRILRPTYCSMRAWTLLQHQIQTSPKVKVNGKEANIRYMKFFRPGEKIGPHSLAACTPARRVHACLPPEVGFLVRAEPVTQACQHR